jgi:Mor family transcriptional regulator
MTQIELIEKVMTMVLRLLAKILEIIMYSDRCTNQQELDERAKFVREAFYLAIQIENEKNSQVIRGKFDSKKARDIRNIEIFQLYKHGHSYSFLMDKFGLSRSAVWQAIKRGKVIQPSDFK